MKYSLLISILLCTLTGWSQSGAIKVYRYTRNDTLLTRDFVDKLCEAARTKSGSRDPDRPSDLEKLINIAAGTSFKAGDQSVRVAMWWGKYFSDCRCERNYDFPEGDILRQIVHSDFRDFANLVVPKGRLALNLSLTDPMDNRTIYQYVNALRENIEKSYDHHPPSFQNDLNWKKVMFFQFLFSENLQQMAPNSVQWLFPENSPYKVP